MKRNVLIISLIICLVAILACGSLAYFSASHTTTNKFMTAAYDPADPEKPINPDDLFSITVMEDDLSDSPETDAEGNPLPTTSGNLYQNILPGASYKKNPTVKNTGKYSQWVRITVIFDQASFWNDAGYGKDKLFDAVVLDMNKSLWTALDPVEDKTADTITYTFYYNNKLNAGETAVAFENVQIPATLNTAEMAKLSVFTISVKADAIQADYNGTTPAEGFLNWPN